MLERNVFLIKKQDQGQGWDLSGHVVHCREGAREHFVRHDGRQATTVWCEKAFMTERMDRPTLWAVSAD